MNKTTAGLVVAPVVMLLGLMGMSPIGDTAAVSAVADITNGVAGSQAVGSGEGRLTPKTIRARRAVLAAFGPMVVHGWGTRGDVTEHDDGRALDFMAGADKAKGHAISRWLVAHADQLDVQYVIYAQHIWKARSPARGWVLMEDRGGVTENHEDHPHLSILP